MIYKMLREYVEFGRKSPHSQTMQDVARTSEALMWIHHYGVVLEIGLNIMPMMRNNPQDFFYFALVKL